MSAPLNLDATGLRDIADALADFAKIARQHNVTVGAHGEQRITHTDRWGAETVLRLELKSADGDPTYVLADRIGD